jgi:hypothetical protein
LNVYTERTGRHIIQNFAKLCEKESSTDPSTIISKTSRRHSRCWMGTTNSFHHGRSRLSKSLQFTLLSLSTTVYPGSRRLRHKLSHGTGSGSSRSLCSVLH